MTVVFSETLAVAVVVVVFIVIVVVVSVGMLAPVVMETFNDSIL